MQPERYQPDTSLFDRAAEFAIKAHSNVYRKGKNIPYILHPMEAAMITSSMTEDQEILAAAILHDVVEDTEVTVDEIRSEFGDRVARLVEWESVMDEDAGEELSAEEKDRRRVNSWRRRKARTIRRVAEGDLDSKMIAMGDKLSNLRAINRDYQKVGEALWRRFRTHNPKDHEWYYRSFAEALRELADTAAYKEYIYLLHKTFDSLPPNRQMTMQEVLRELQRREMLRQNEAQEREENSEE